jgi:hypothetical protein
MNGSPRTLGRPHRGGKTASKSNLIFAFASTNPTIFKALQPLGISHRSARRARSRRRSRLPVHVRFDLKASVANGCNWGASSRRSPGGEKSSRKHAYFDRGGRAEDEMKVIPPMQVEGLRIERLDTRALGKLSLKAHQHLTNNSLDAPGARICRCDHSTRCDWTDRRALPHRLARIPSS